MRSQLLSQIAFTAGSLIILSRMQISAFISPAPSRLSPNMHDSIMRTPTESRSPHYIPDLSNSLHNDPFTAHGMLLRPLHAYARVERGGIAEFQSRFNLSWYLRYLRLRLSLLFSRILQRSHRVEETASVAAPVVEISTPAVTTVQRNENKTTRASRIVEQLTESFLIRQTMHTLNLKVQADSNTNLPEILNGKVKGVTATFDRLAFRNLKVSGGGRLSAQGLTLTPLSFAPGLEKVLQRFRSPFELHACDCILTQDDVMNSSCIRNGLQRLLNMILKKLLLQVSVVELIMALSISKVRIMDTNKIACSGTGITVLGAPFPFEVRSGLSVSPCGHILQFPGIELVINPGPLQAVVPIHAMFPVDLDIGNNARIENLFIDGRRQRFHLNARATIMPNRFSLAKYRPKTDVITAKFSFDLGLWLARIFQISK